MPVDHIAFPTKSIRKTYDFYTGVMGWSVGIAWGREKADRPFFIIGFDTGSFMLEFEEEVGADHPSPAQGTAFPHIGVEIGADERDAWRERFDEHGVEYVELGTDLWVSDPNGVKLQLFLRSEEQM